MRKTHGKKQTLKNKTKRRAIRGGRPPGSKGYPRGDYGNRKPGSTSQGSSFQNLMHIKNQINEHNKSQNQSTNPTSSVTHNNKAHKALKVGNPNVSKSKSVRPSTRSQTSKSTAQ